MGRHATTSIALLGLLCVTGLFLFPAAWGSFTATHGPATALRAKRFCALLFLAMGWLAERVANRVGLSLGVFGAAVPLESVLSSDSFLRICALRC